YRYQLQGPGAMEVLRDATGEEPPQLKFFNMTTVTIANKPVRVLRHGMAGEPGVENWGPWQDHQAVHRANHKTGNKHRFARVGARAHHTTALAPRWLSHAL